MPMGEKQQGFTLVEVVIAVAIAAFLMTIVYSVFSTTTQARTRAEESSSRFQQARVFFQRLSRELRGSNWSAGDETTAFTVTREADGFKEIILTTLAGAALRSGQADGTTVRYVLEKDNGDLRTLYRLISNNQGSAVGEPEKYTIISDIAELGMRVFNNGAWFETWNAEDEKRLPKLVEITLKIRYEGRDLAFSTTVDIPMSGG